MEPAVARRRKEATLRQRLNKTGANDACVHGDASPGEFVRLAAAIDECIAFNPKQWKHVLDNSASLLRSNFRCEKGGSTAVRHRPLSREEDTEASMDINAFSALSVTQCLDQPELVRDILKEAEREKEGKLQEAENESNDDALLDAELQVEELEDKEVEKDVGENDGPTSDAGDTVKKKTSMIVLPLLTTMSPRTRQRLARLPSPSAAEMQEIERFTRSVDHPEFSEGFYREMKRSQIQQARRENMTHKLAETMALSTVPRAGSLATTLQKRKRPRGVIKPLNTRNELDVKTFTSSAVTAVENDRTWKSNEQKTTENDNTVELNLSRKAATELSTQRLLPRGDHKIKRFRSYSKLIRERNQAQLQHGVARHQVKETIDEIKQWVPLDAIYACGLGKFASPAQQRAAELLFRVGVRLKNQVLYLGMCHWKALVIAMREQEWMQASIRLQCWWRQMSAKLELAMRRRIRRELEDFLSLLSSKQHQAAYKITRCVRHIALRHSTALRQKAAICIQKFWRQLCTQWAALRRELQRQIQNKAAICIQKHGRRIVAQRRRVLLSKINHVETNRLQKGLEIAARARNTKMLGAAISIQRGLRKWQQKQTLLLCRRRAAFDRDKKKILQVQAHYRGQQARKWASNHKRDVRKAVLIIQCAWRGFLARRELSNRKQEAVARRNRIRKEIEANHRARKVNLVPIQLQKKWGQISVLKANMFRPGDVCDSREVQAATKVQARWRGKQLRKKLRSRNANEMERSRRQVNRKRRLAAVCIQKRVRGIQGRAHAWQIMQIKSVTRIQRVWRGHKSRVQLVETRNIIKMIKRIQSRWKARRSVETQRFRNLNAAIIQGAIRRFIGGKMLSTVVRRRQFLAEMYAVGKILEERIRSCIKDELLLQSFSFKAAKLADEKAQPASGETFVDQSLYIVDFAKKQWKRKGYNGVWQEVFRDACGNLAEMDNSHFVKFLKALPHAFIHKTQFPIQNADIVFVKIKEPNAKTISFARFNKGVLMLLKEKFADSSNQNELKESELVKSSTNDFKHFLRFMNRFVLPSTIQNGKYRRLLEAHCNKRLLWSVAVLRRFAIRILTKRKHDKFIVILREQQMVKHRNNCAAVIQQAYLCYKFRLQVKSMLASMFIEFIDYTGRTVKVVHVASGKILTKRPIFMKGVQCDKIVPLPYPGEEFSAFCERHEDSTDPNAAKVPSEVYCVECEDTMCAICFDRDHKARKAFQKHQPRKIQKCSHCNSETATRECLQCGNGKVPFCDSCFPHVHKQRPQQPKRDGNESHHEMFDTTVVECYSRENQHEFQALVVMCAECSNRVAQWSCEICLDIFCKRCMSSFHAKGLRQHHHCHRLHYYSVLRQKAELKRVADVKKEREFQKKQREEEKREQEAELARQNLAATKIQALVRSFVARQSGKAYMKLVRQARVAWAQRKQDDKVRSSITYKVKAALGVSPALRSDTKQEAAARRQRIDHIKRTLLFQRLPQDKFKPAKTHWSKRQEEQVLEATRTWCNYGEQVKILRGEWKNCVGSIVSINNLMLTGSVLVFIPVASRSTVVRWVNLEPYDQDAILRRAYEPPGQVALNVTRDFRAKISRVLECAIRKARLLYLQMIEFHRITQFAWVVEYNKQEQKVEYWNVVLNRRTLTAPKTMQFVENMEPGDREKLEKRVDLARSKLVALLNPFQSKNKLKLALRRNAVVFVSGRGNEEESNPSVLYLKHEMEAIDGARFWHDKVISNRQFGGKKVQKLIAASSSAACWSLVQLFYWMDLHEDGGFEPHARKLLGLTKELQVYVVHEMSDRFEGSGDVKCAREKLLQLLNLKEVTLQLLSTKRS